LASLTVVCRLLICNSLLSRSLTFQLSDNRHICLMGVSRVSQVSHAPKCDNSATPPHLISKRPRFGDEKMNEAVQCLKICNNVATTRHKLKYNVNKQHNTNDKSQNKSNKRIQFNDYCGFWFNTMSMYWDLRRRPWRSRNATQSSSSAIRIQYVRQRVRASTIRSSLNRVAV
jgi:hypothetical protein